MDFEEAKTVIESLENGAEIMGAVTGAINSEKEKGIKLKSDANHEAQSLKQYKTAFTTMGFNTDDGNLSEFVDNLIVARDSADKSKNKLTKNEQEIINLKKSVETLTTQYNAEQTEKKALLQKDSNNRITKGLSKAFDGSIYGEEFAINTLIAKNTVGIVDDVVVFNGTDNTTISIEDGVKQFKIDNPGIVINKQAGGGGGSGDGGNPNNEPTDAERIAKFNNRNGASLNYK